MKTIIAASVIMIFVAAEGIAQSSSAQSPRGMAQRGAVTGFVSLPSGFYQAVYDSGIFPISGSPLSGQIPGTDNVVLSITSNGSGIIAGIDALSSDSINVNGTDGGVWEYSGSWSKIGNPHNTTGSLPSHSIIAVADDGLYTYAAMPGADTKSESPSFGGVWRLGSGGSWDSCYSGPMTDSSFIPVLYEDWTGLYAGALSSDVPIQPGTKGLGIGGVFRSTDHGTTWTDISYDLPNRDIVAITRMYSHLLVSTLYKGVFWKDTGGTSWTQIPFADSTNAVWCFAPDTIDYYLYAGTLCIDSLHFKHGLFQMIGDGAGWAPVAVTGLLDSTIISALGVYDGTLYIGTGGVFGMSSQHYGLLSYSIPISAVHSLNALPSAFELRQNFPNPFNPSTEIQYQLPAGGFVTLKVFDVVGREVMTVVNERQNAGEHSALVDAGSLTSGVYFYRLTAGIFVQTKKMIVLK